MIISILAADYLLRAYAGNPMKISEFSIMLLYGMRRKRFLKR